MSYLDEARAVMIAAADKIEQEAAQGTNTVRQGTSEAAGYLTQAGEMIYARYADRLTSISEQQQEVLAVARNLAEDIRNLAATLGQS